MSDSVGSVSVDVVPDARGWSEKLRAQIRDQSVTVNADADTTEAETQLDEVARPRSATINAKVDKDAVSQLDSFVGKLGLLPALAITAGAALVPLAGALAGVTAALAAPLAIAGGGATLFALLGGLAVKQTNDQLKQIDDLDTKLSGLTRGTQEYADVQKQLRVAQSNLSPAQEAFASSLGRLKAAFDELLGGSTGRSLLGPFTQGMDLLSHLLPVVSPLLEAVSHAFSTLLGDLSDAAGGRGFSHFVDQFARLAGPDIVGFGRILGHLASGLGQLLIPFDKHLGGNLVDDLVKLSGQFDHWAGSDKGRRAIQGFFDYFHRVGPQVADTIGATARAVGHIVSALAPLGPPVLKVVEGIADALSGIPVPVLTALAAATGGLVAFQKVGGLKGVSALTGGLGGGGPLGSVLGSARPVPVFVTNPGFNAPDGVPRGSGPGARGALNTVGTVAAGVTAVGAINSVIDPLFKKEFGDTVGDALARGIRGAFALPDPKLASAGPHILNSIIHGGGKSPGQLPTDSVPAGFLATQSRAATDRARAAAFAGLGTGPLQNVEKHLTSVSTHLDAMRAHAATASRGLDQIGPHGEQAAGKAQHAIDVLNNHIQAIHDKRFAVIAQTANAIQSLERLQALRIADKTFTVYQRNQVIERAVGPGGGRGVSNPGGNSGGGASGGGAGRTPVHIHLDDNGKRNITGYMDDRYHANAQADRAYDDARAGR